MKCQQRMQAEGGSWWGEGEGGAEDNGGGGGAGGGEGGDGCTEYASSVYFFTQNLEDGNGKRVG